MAADTPAGAVARFLQPLRDALACVTSARVDVSADGYQPNPTGTAHRLYLNRGAPAPLAGRHRLALRVAMRYRIVHADGPRGPWRVHTAAYSYAIDASDEHELVAYHWQENGTPPAPHLHLGAGSGSAALLRRTHLPTGRVALEAVLRFLVTELDVVPLRRGWRTVLDRSEQRFRTWRTWG